MHMEQSPGDLHSHPLIGSPSTERVLSMDKAELRLLDNARKAVHDCDILIEKERIEDCCIEILLKGLDAARKLRQKFTGKTTEQYNRTNFIALLETSIPTSTQSGATYEIRSTKTGETKPRSVSEIIYDEVRCIMIHENDNLNEAELEGINHPVKLRWGVPTEDFVLSHENGVVVINGMLLLRRLREILSHFITLIEAVKSFAETGKAAVTICPPIGSIKPTTRRHDK
ncbi:MAG: hypothetical protein RLZZ233_1125 [Verrucomicrobiota bacterium]